MLLNSVLEAVGSVPLIRLTKMSSGNVFVKAEHLNPGGSIKDRVAKHIIESATPYDLRLRFTAAIRTPLGESIRS
jgi:cysteine synthase